MKEFKGFIFYTIIAFAIIGSFLMIKVHNYAFDIMNQKIEFSLSDSENDFIVQSRKQLNEYKMNAKNEDVLVCIDAVGEKIDNFEKQNKSGIEIKYIELLVNNNYNMPNNFYSNKYSIILYDKCINKASNTLKKNITFTSQSVNRLINQRTYDLFVYAHSIAVWYDSNYTYYAHMNISEDIKSLQKLYIGNLLELVGELNEE